MLTFTLETITPLFLAGSNPRGEPELRAPSVRGVLRYWLRALLGGVIGDRNWDELRKAEADVFGSIGRASPLVVQVKSGPLSLQSFSEIAKRDNTGRGYRRRGIAYLFFAARGTRNEPERSAIGAGNSFKLIISRRVGVDVSGNQALQQAYAALWLLTHLGGLGARSRRGAGSLQTTTVEGEVKGLPALTVRANKAEDLQKELQEGLQSLRRFVDGNALVYISKPSEFNVLHPDVCKVWVVNQEFDSWDEALDKIGHSMQRFRSRRNPDYQNVKRAIQRGDLNQPVQRAAFGLPIVFYYRSLQGQKGILEGEHHDRRASPLIIHITKLANGKYAIVLTVFYARLLPSNERLKLKRKGRPCIVEPPNLNLIDEFLEYLSNDIASLLEVPEW